MILNNTHTTSSIYIVQWYANKHVHAHIYQIIKIFSYETNIINLHAWGDSSLQYPQQTPKIRGLSLPVRFLSSLYTMCCLVLLSLYFLAKPKSIRNTCNHTIHRILHNSHISWGGRRQLSTSQSLCDDGLQKCYIFVCMVDAIRIHRTWDYTIYTKYITGISIDKTTFSKLHWERRIC